jgi:hypothetical protein
MHNLPWKSSSVGKPWHEFIDWIVLFKLSQDMCVGVNHYIYGGRDASVELAMKAAGHELRGATNIFPFHSLGIRVPMQALVDFHGYRLVAMPLLPLRKLIYGSDDGGHTVHRSDALFNARIARAADELHLAEHRVSSQGTPLHMAGMVHTTHSFHASHITQSC